jgi:superfamily II DNA or RNA helicase
MPLRKHQKEMADTVESIIAGATTRNILVKAVPGAGKSTIPLQAGKLITAGLADKICWICPRMSLQDQAERNFLDQYFRRLFNHSLTIRSSTNDRNPSRGTNGFVSTYQALGFDDQQTVLADFKRYRYILVLDEYHHAGEDGIWTQALGPLYDLAAFRILLTGTLMRGDKKKIAFTPYEMIGDMAIPCLRDDDETVAIEYSRQDALRDKAILPLSFTMLGGSAKWETPDGKEVDAKLATKDKRKAGHALFTALNTEYARELLNMAIIGWEETRKKIPKASLLVVSASIDTAKEYNQYLKDVGIKSEIATSEDSEEAIKNIKALKMGRIDALVTCQMGYEGMDCPSISHIACLTNIRSEPWIAQCVGRAVRIDPFGGPYEEQTAYIFAPDDQLMQDVVKRIEAEQDLLLAPGKKKRSLSPVSEDLFGEKLPGITPLSSQMTGKREVSITATDDIRTNSEIEKDLRKSIEEHIRHYSFQNRYNPKKINWELVLQFGKGRQDMTLPELERVLAYCKHTFPLMYVRGTGRPRVATKAQPIAVRWA